MALQVLKGRITGYRRKREVASFLFTDGERDEMGAIAIAAALVGQPGQAIGTASAAASADEEADYLEFEVNGQPVKGWVWRSPFKEGDEVEVAAEWQQDHYELCAIARPVDQIIALYPHCSRGSRSHWTNAWKWWFLGTSFLLLFSFLFMVFVWSVFLSEPLLNTLGFLELLMPTSAAFFFSVFALMTWSLARKWMPFVRLSEKVFSAFNWEAPGSVDLVKRSKDRKTGGEPPEYGVMYFRY
jgi:hypothetical protein